MLSLTFKTTLWASSVINDRNRLEGRGMKLGDFCCITYVNTQKTQGDDSDMLNGHKKNNHT